MKRTYYGIEYRYGRMRDESGYLIGELHAFASKRDRDEWAVNGNPYITERGAREIIAASSKEVQHEIKHEPDRIIEHV